MIIILKSVMRSLLLSVLFSISIWAQDSGFLLSTGKVNAYYPAYLGNGTFSISSTQLGTAPANSFMAKFYDEGKNDIPRLAALPSWNEINYFNGNNWLNSLNINSGKITDYNQTLNMFDGYLETSYTWNDSPDRNSNIRITSFVSRDNKNLAVIKFQLTANFSDEILLIFPMTEQMRPDRLDLARLKTIDFGKPNNWPYFWYPGFSSVKELNAAKINNGGSISALVQSEGRQTNVGLVSQILFDDNSISPDIEIGKTSNSAAIKLKFRTQAGRKYTFFKFVSIVPQNEKNINLIEEASQNINRSILLGYDKLFLNHKTAWNKLWDTDIIIDGDNELQKIVRSMIFYLLGSSDANTNFGIPAMGLSTAGYFGHIFWDSDTYMFPPLLLMHPEIAKSLVAFRHTTLQSAIENAKLNNYKGAMYPWESDELGKETTPFFAYQNAVKENHIVGDVAFAQWQYFAATKDTAYMKNYGAEIIRQTADFWSSRVTYNREKDRYEIHKLISVSESEKDVNNETYTNSIAKLNLKLAIKISNILKLNINPAWSEVSNKMFIPFNVENKFHPLYENADAGEGATRFWSSVVNLLDYPLQIEMNNVTKRNNLIHAIKSLESSGSGAMMGINFLSIVAAELQSDSLLNLTLEKTLKGYLKPPFYVLSETHENNSVNFLTGAGSFLQQVIFGYTGLRITDAGIVEKYKPMLPHKIKKLTLKNFTINDKKCDIIIENNGLRKLLH